jgi:tetratricopeptide (TPR) repeat protein
VCEAELWDEALVELERQNYAPVIRESEPAWRARIYLGMGRYDKVLALKEQARRCGCPIEPFLAVAYARLGQTERAHHIAAAALRLKRQGAELALGHVCFAAQEYDVALRWYDAAAQDRLHRADALRAAGSALIAQGDHREARVAYEQAIRLTPFVRPEDVLQLAHCLRETRGERAAAAIEQLAHDNA